MASLIASSQPIQQKRGHMREGRWAAATASGRAGRCPLVYPAPKASGHGFKHANPIGELRAAAFRPPHMLLPVAASASQPDTGLRFPGCKSAALIVSSTSEDRDRPLIGASAPICVSG